MIGKKHVFAIDLVLIVLSLFVLIVIVGYARPLVIAPIDDFATTSNFVLFEFEKAEVIYLDDNPDFTSPQKFFTEDELVINLKPGVYYWKVEGTLASPIRKFTIISEIDLRLKETADGKSYRIVNAGNDRLNVDIYENGKLTGNVVLDVDEEEDAFGDSFKGKLGGGGDE